MTHPTNYPYKVAVKKAPYKKKLGKSKVRVFFKMIIVKDFLHAAGDQACHSGEVKLG